MKEAFYFAPPSDEAGSVAAPELSSLPEPLVSVKGGFYRDPDPNVVAWISDKFTDPQQNIEATLMKAFEWSGIVKTPKEIRALTQPLEASGLLPEDTQNGEPPGYAVDPDQSSSFTDIRDEQLLLELQEGNDKRNNVLKRVQRTTTERLAFDDDQVDDLVQFRVSVKPHNKYDYPPAYQILRVMVGVMPPSNPELKQGFTANIPKLTYELAPDVYFMMLREEQELQSVAEKQPA